MLPVLILFILQDFLDGNFLAGLPVGAEVDHSKGALACNSLNLVLVVGRDGFGLLVDGDAGLIDLVRLGLHDLVVVGGFVGVDFEIAAIGIGLLGDVF